MNRSFHSFNTPENIRLENQWNGFFGGYAEPMKMRDFLPAHYREIPVIGRTDRASASSGRGNHTVCGYPLYASYLSLLNQAQKSTMTRSARND